jgi:hypothetical protein
MNKPWKVVLAFAAVFAAGAIFGGLLMVRIGPRIMEQKRAKSMPPTPPMLLRHFTDQLNLTAAQKEKIRPMVEKVEEEMHLEEVNHLKEEEEKEEQARLVLQSLLALQSLLQPLLLQYELHFLHL